MEENKLTKEVLISLIEEVINELACHKKEDGKWTKCEPGAVYSALDSNDRVGDKFKGRGTISKKNKDGTYRLVSKYGSNQSKKTSSGRKTMSGEDISPKYYVGDRYKRTYKEEVLHEQWTAIQQWLASQDSGKKEPLLEDDECSGKYSEGFRKGQQAVIQFIAQYTRATNPKK